MTSGTLQRYSVTYHILCGKCEYEERVEVQHRAAAETELRQRGWAIHQQQWHCPTCLCVAAADGLNVE